MATKWIDFDDVKQKLSIKEALRRLGRLDEFTEKGQKLRGKCPLAGHQHNKITGGNPTQWVADLSSGLWYCHGDCQRGGSVIDLISGVLNLSAAHTRLWILENCADLICPGKPPSHSKKIEACEEETAGHSPRSDKTTINTITDDISPSTPLLPLKFTMRLEREHPYLDERQVGMSTRDKYDIGFCKPSPRRRYFDGYLCSPIYRYPLLENNERPVGYIGRWPGRAEECGENPRYKLPEGFPKQRVCYGMHQALDTDNKHAIVVVVESIWSVWHLYQSGFDAVSLLGSSISPEQADLIYSLDRPLVLMFDGDSSGDAGRNKARELLATCPGCFINEAILPAGAKPHHLSPAELSSLLTR